MNNVIFILHNMVISNKDRVYVKLFYHTGQSILNTL